MHRSGRVEDCAAVTGLHRPKEALITAQIGKPHVPCGNSQGSKKFRRAGTDVLDHQAKPRHPGYPVESRNDPVGGGLKLSSATLRLCTQCPQFCDSTLQACKVGVRRAFAATLGKKCKENFPDREQILDGSVIQSHDERALLRHDANDPRRFQQSQRLPDWPAAHTEARGQLDCAQMIPGARHTRAYKRPNLVCDDGGASIALSHLVVPPSSLDCLSRPGRAPVSRDR